MIRTPPDAIALSHTHPVVPFWAGGAASKPRGGNPAPIHERIRDILESARAGVARSVNTTQVVANWLIGREIVEEEQQGKKRAGYGKELLADLSARLTVEFAKGFSRDNLFWFRRLYLGYPNLANRKFDATGQVSVHSPSLGIAHALTAQLMNESERFHLTPER